MRDGVPDAERPKRGRPPKQTVEQQLKPTPIRPTARSETTPSNRSDNNVNNVLAPNVGTPETIITQPFNTTVGTNSSPGRSLADQLSFTGLPPYSPFQQQTMSQEPTFNEPAIPGEQASSRQKGPGLVPPGKRDPPTPTQSPVYHSTPDAEQAGHLLDHNYSSRLPQSSNFDNLPSPVYHPTVSPPPGFYTTQGQGRPQRQTRMPVKFQDYETYATRSLF